MNDVLNSAQVAVVFLLSGRDADRIAAVYERTHKHCHDHSCYDIKYRMLF